MGAALYLWVRGALSALPQPDGRLQVAGLSAPVTVTRDGHGVPTIEAASLEDLFFAQGFVVLAQAPFMADGCDAPARGVANSRKFSARTRWRSIASSGF